MLMLVIGSPAIYAKKKHKSAEKIGEEDSQSCNNNDCKGLYISQPGKGFGDHSPEFNHNYIKGFCKHQPPGTGSDEDQATFDRP